MTISSKINEVQENYDVPTLDFFNDMFVSSMSSTDDTAYKAFKGQNVASVIFEYIEILNTIITKEVRKQSGFLNSILSNDTTTYNNIFPKFKQLYTKTRCEVAGLMLKAFSHAKNTFHNSMRKVAVQLDRTTNIVENAIDDCMNQNTADDLSMCIEDFVRTLLNYI